VTAAFIVRLAGITAHYRDPRYNTGAIGRNPLPIGTLHCPPPCTMHAMLCAARGGWVNPIGLVMGWRMDFDSVCADFQTCHLPQRKEYDFRRGVQKVKTSPRVREFLSFPRLTILVLSGAEATWFRRPVNPLLFGRSEDLVTAKKINENLRWKACNEGIVSRQCVPMFVGSGPLYPAPLYFGPNRVPIAMSPKTDARLEQSVRVGDFNRQPPLAQLEDTGESFFLWDYGRAAG
jgi:hypothetical protein